MSFIEFRWSDHSAPTVEHEQRLEVFGACWKSSARRRSSASLPRTTLGAGD
jgi:hypothetical protein